MRASMVLLLSDSADSDEVLGESGALAAEHLAACVGGPGAAVPGGPEIDGLLVDVPDLSDRQGLKAAHQVDVTPPVSSFDNLDFHEIFV